VITEDPPRHSRTGIPPADASASRAFAHAASHVAEIREYVAIYVAARVDALKLVLRQVVLYAVLGIIGLLAAATGVIMAVALLLMGAADGISATIPGHQHWVGDFIVGGSVLALLGVGAYMVAKSVARSSRKLTVEKYESRKRNQRVQSDRGHRPVEKRSN
jgi:hypothetical protein